MKLRVAVAPKLQVRWCSLQYTNEWVFRVVGLLSHTFFGLVVSLASTLRFLAFASVSFPGFKRPSFSAAAAARFEADRT